jgi:hypothetical protein
MVVQGHGRVLRCDRVGAGAIQHDLQGDGIRLAAHAGAVGNGLVHRLHSVALEGLALHAALGSNPLVGLVDDANHIPRPAA